LKALDYRVFAANASGGKNITVYLDGAGLDHEAMLTLAQNRPLTVFVRPSEQAVAQLHCYTPKGHKAESDSAAIAALAALGATTHGLLAWADQSTVAWRAGKTPGQYLLLQGDPLVTTSQIERAAVAAALGLDEDDLHEDLPVLIGSLGRPNLIVPLKGALWLDAIESDGDKISLINRQSHSSGLVAFTFPGRGGAFIDARAFGPLRGFLEDAASSNMLACLAGYLAHARFFDAGVHEFLAAQGYALGKASRLALKCTVTGDVASQVWVGGTAQAVAC
jgi:PhzF family phenazine biosynthesis protein